MQEIIRFIDSYVGDDQLYWRIPTLYTKEIYEVLWNPGAIPWKIRLVDGEGEDWEHFSSEDIVMELNSRQVDLVMFEVGLRYSALERLVVAHLTLEAGRKVFGDDIVDESIAQYKQFFETLVDTVNETLEQYHEQKEKSEKNSQEEIEEKPKVIKHDQGNVIKFPFGDVEDDKEK